MNELLKNVLLAVVAAVVAVVVYAALVGGNQPGDGLGAGTRFPNGISVDGTAPSAGLIRGADLTLTDDAVVGDDLTVSGQLVDITTANSATSTLKTGCIQMTATSTASPIKLVLGIPSSTATTSQYGATTVGAVYYAFGTCP